MIHALSNFGIRAKLNTVIFTALIGLIIVVASNLYHNYSTLEQGEITKSKSVVEVGMSILKYYENLVKSGKLSLEEAQRQAKAHLKEVRYQGGNYFSLYDVNSKMLMHPLKPDLIGKDLSQLKDPNGVLIVYDLVKLAKQSSDGGYVKYLWTKPGANNGKPVDKVAYAKLYESWGWVIATGPYLDDIWDQFINNVISIIVQITIVFIIILIVSYIVSQNIVNPLKSLRNIIKSIEQSHDLKQRIPIEGSDEVSVIAQNFNSLMSEFERMIQSLGQIIHKVTYASDHLNKLSSHIENSSTEQKDSSMRVAASIEQMSSNIENISDNTKEVNEIAKQSISQTGIGQQNLQLLSKNIDQLEHIVMEKVSQDIDAFIQHMDSIQKMTQQVKDIAEQTNLLALNASIEAARAGEQGKGFAVVADEVRKLAEKSSTSANQIDAITRTLMNQSEQVTNSLDEGKQFIQHSQKSMSQVAGILKESSGYVEKTHEGIFKINSYLDEQSSTSQHIEKSIMHINSMAEQNFTAVHDIGKAIHDMNRLANELETMLNNFKVS